MQGDHRRQCDLGQRRDGAQHFGQLRAPGEIAAERVDEHAPTQFSQRDRKRAGVARGHHGRERRPRIGPIERPIQRGGHFVAELLRGDERLPGVTAERQRAIEIHVGEKAAGRMRGASGPGCSATIVATSIL